MRSNIKLMKEYINAGCDINCVSDFFSPTQNAYLHDATGLITGVQPVHFTPDAEVVIDARIPTGDLDLLPPETRSRLAGVSPSPTPEAPR